MQSPLPEGFSDWRGLSRRPYRVSERQGLVSGIDGWAGSSRVRAPTPARLGGCSRGRSSGRGVCGEGRHRPPRHECLQPDFGVGQGRGRPRAPWPGQRSKTVRSAAVRDRRATAGLAVARTESTDWGPNRCHPSGRTRRHPASNVLAWPSIDLDPHRLGLGSKCRRPRVSIGRRGHLLRRSRSRDPRLVRAGSSNELSSAAYCTTFAQRQAGIC